MNPFQKFTAWLRTKPLFVLGIVPLTFLCLAAAPASRDYFLSTLRVYPAADENGTNSVTFYNKGGTNWWGIEPTNALQKIRYNGSNYTAFATTNLYLTNAAAGAGRIIVIRNGLVVDVIAQ